MVKLGSAILSGGQTDHDPEFGKSDDVVTNKYVLTFRTLRYRWQTKWIIGRIYSRLDL